MSEDVEQEVSKPRGRKSVPWRRDPVILARLPKVERLHLAGRPNTAIAADLGLDEITIRRDLERLRELWLERTQAEQDANRARALAELEDVRVRALQAAEWDLACEKAVLFGGSVDDGDDDPLRVYRDKKGSAQFRGNKAAALKVAHDSTMSKAKILGIVVDKAALTDTKGEDLPLEDLMDRFARRRAKDADAEAHEDES